MCKSHLKVLCQHWTICPVFNIVFLLWRQSQDEGDGTSCLAGCLLCSPSTFFHPKGFFFVYPHLKLNKVPGVFSLKGSFPFSSHLYSDIFFQVQHGLTHRHTITQALPDTPIKNTSQTSCTHAHTNTHTHSCLFCANSRTTAAVSWGHVAWIFGLGQQTQVRGSVRQWCCH